MRRVVQDGQKPRRLQEKATSISSQHDMQRTRAKPCARSYYGSFLWELIIWSKSPR